MDRLQSFADALRLLDERKVGTFLEEFQKETDRAAAILGGAYLDASLLRILKKVVVVEHGFAKNLLASDRPLGTFSARIDASAAFGQLSEEEFRDLHTVRAIRNDFAHSEHGLSFESEKPAKLVSSFHLLRRLEGLPMFAGQTPRIRFNIVVALLSVLLSQREARALPFVMADHQWYVPASQSPAGSDQGTAPEL